MQLYNFDRDNGRIVRDGLDTGVPQNWALYSACEADEEIARLKAEAERTWRCFHCGEACKGEADARNHFGSLEGSEPACQIKAAGEFALLRALRNAEERLQRYHAEDSDIMRAMASMQSDHSVALRREEEAGYGKAVAHMRAEAQLLKAALRWALQIGAHTDGQGEVVVLDDDGCSYAPEIPPEFAPLIAEATK